MKRPLIIGNWKSHKSVKEVENWFLEVSASLFSVPSEVVLCPPFPLLPLCRKLIKENQLPWKLGSQDISRFSVGKHTGEVNGLLLKDFVEYVLIGHSERRQQLQETEEILFEKVKRANEVNLQYIYFIQGEDTPIPEGVRIIAYEPVFAIGTGNPDTPEHAEQVANYFKKTKHVSTVLYGGSVDDKNVEAFMSCPSLDGVVPGTASLDPTMFSKLIKNA